MATGVAMTQKALTDVGFSSEMSDRIEISSDIKQYLPQARVFYGVTCAM